MDRRDDPVSCTTSTPSSWRPESWSSPRASPTRRQAKTVRYQDGETVVTDGPFAESRESLAGFWIVDVEDEARALEITSRVVAFTHGPIEVRQVPDGPPAEYV